MQYGPYSIITESSLRYKFYSNGPRGRILKCVIYKKLPDNPDFYNLAFGDVHRSGDINDMIVTDNKDSERVLATVVITMKNFFRSHPDKAVYITGSTDARIRLYRMAISRHLGDLGNEFRIFGFSEGQWRPFQINLAYSEFMVEIKNEDISNNEKKS